MAMLTDYLADALRDHVLRNTTFTSPTTVYLGLFTTATTKAGGGTEVTGGSYARQSIAFSAPSTGLASQTSTVTFTGMPSCTVSHLALFNHVSAGNMLIIGMLAVPKTLTAGQTFQLAAGDLRPLFN